MASRPSSSVEDPPGKTDEIDQAKDNVDVITKPEAEDRADDENNISWKEKYELAEKQLKRVRQQTGKVRELLNMKMEEYEGRVVSAEKKRDEALEKLEKLEIACEDKDEAISALREKISRMREERASLLLLDDEKMVKVKDWVKDKFTGLYQELESVKKERDDLQERLSKDIDGRASHLSTTNSQHFYEEVFFELIDGLKKTDTIEKDEPPRYERISLALSESDGATGFDSPLVPPRRSSIRDESRPLKPIPAKRPVGRPKSPEVFREMFDLPEEPSRHGSLDNLDKQMLQLSTEHLEAFRGTEVEGAGGEVAKEPTSPFYYSLHPSVSGTNYVDDQSAPVYSTLEGMASMIRDTPFSGDTSDSDSETLLDGPTTTSSRPNNTIELKTANNLPVKKDLSLRSNYSAASASPPLRTCAPFTAQNMRSETLEKAGWLVKLGGRIKNWKRRWFVLSEGKLSYYKSRGGMYGKPVGWIVIKQITQLSRSERPLTMEITTPNRTYYLTADNKEEVTDWLRVLRNALKRFTGARLLSRVGEKTIFSGWFTKAKCGSSKHCWAVLKEKSLLFFKTDIEQAPVGAMSLREIISVTTVEDEAPNEQESDGSCKLMVQCLKDSHPTYFVVASRSEMELWLHHLQRMCSGTDANNETDFEAIVSKLMKLDGDTGSRYWRSKIMVHSKQALKESLSSLPTSELETEAVNLWKSIQLFSTTPVNETAIDYHIALAQDVLQNCLNHAELQTEIYCQLIKQTSKYRGQPQPEGSTAYLNDWTSANMDEGGYGTIDLNPVSSFVYLQCWQLLALCTSIFLPKLKILWLLKAHLHRNASESSDVGRYAIYCQRSLERTLKNGERETKPSRMEAIALIARNPFYRIYPMSIPVYFVNNSYQVFSFDGSTTISEFNTNINEELGLRNNNESGFALYSDNPVAQTEHCMQGDLKLCDVISKWEQACQKLKTGRFERSKAIKLTYKNRLFFKSSAGLQTDKEKYFTVFQVNEALRMGHMLPAPPVLSKLTAYFSQIAFGDYVEHFKLLEDIMQKIYPAYLKLEQASIRRKVFKSVADDWSALKGKSIKECVHGYLHLAQAIPLYGSKLFKAQEKLVGNADSKEPPTTIWIAIDEERLQILSKDLEPRKSYEWSNVVTFGGFKEDFMMVVQDVLSPGDAASPGETTDVTNRHLFAMPPGRVLEVTLLIASYINAVVQKQGLNLDASLDGFAYRGERFSDGVAKATEIHLWDMESQG
ncbi:pleckstrin homology domain-containing family H member 1-like isoform X2 [Clytia hemisphaerica]|uniref:pleckstrin homology domain-containing family H member 1-like isoform X2 n=1 Tax=Clytia hemisphaerica TaxID=252671 RepID=UPI0034D39D49